MSLAVSSVRDMSNQRRARSAKRRDQRRAKKRTAGRSTDAELTDAIRGALKGGHPLSMLDVACMAIHVANREPPTALKPGHRDPGRLDRILTSLIGVRNRETAALLAVIAELLVDDAAAQL